MAISQEFALRVAEISHDKNKLVDLMNQLDEEKRSIRSHQRQYSNDSADQKGLSGVQRFRTLTKLCDKRSFLIEEREYVKQAVGRLKVDNKAMNRAASRPVDYAQAFIAAAEVSLTEEQFNQLEAKASQMLINKHRQNK